MGSQRIGALVLILGPLSTIGCQSPEQPMESGIPAVPANPTAPNIIVIVADDLGYGDVGVFGSETIPTPHIDALAREGVQLTSGYVSGAVCSPTRAGLHTGRYQSRFGYEDNPTANYVRGPDAELGLPEDQTTLANLFQEAGYATGLIGKWHLGIREPYHPLNRGFDEFYGILGGGTSYIDSRLPGTHSFPEEGAPTTRTGYERVIFDGREEVEVPEYLTDVFAEKAVDFIDRHADERFLLMLTPNTPHTPIQATDEYVERVKHIEEEGARIYAAMVVSLDDYVGDVVAALRRHDLERDTLIVFHSDNGCINYIGEVICTNAPLSGGKRYHLEGGIRVPFIIKWPAGLPQGTVYEESVIALDTYSTAAAAAGLETNTPDSVNLLPYLRGETSDPPHEFLYWRSAPNHAIRWGKWKMWKVNNTDLAFGDPPPPSRLLPEVDYPIASPHGQTTVLYDLSADVSEQQNLADQHPEIVERLESELEAWASELAEPMWTSRRSTLDDLHGQTVQLFF
jgi:arylsulfatase A-like enzyme